MATTYSQTRRSRRREETREEALDHAVAIMEAEGVGGLSISEIARRMGIKPPSLYKYFPSLHAVYDALFARGVRSQVAAMEEAVATATTLPDRLRTGAVSIVRWCTDNPALAQLVFHRPVPGFEPSPEAFAPSVASMAWLHEELAAGIADGVLRADTDTDELVALYTATISGLVAQHLANEPGTSFERGRFTSRTDLAIGRLLSHYLPGGTP